jgi:hypothetical protein
MTHHRFVVFGAAAFAVCLVCLFNCFSQAQEGKAIKPSPALAQAANEAYKSSLAAYLNGHATCEDVYQWSRRIMDAELASGTPNSAVADHLTRMKDLHEIVTAKFKQGSADTSKPAVDATNFYLLEAEAMPARLK